MIAVRTPGRREVFRTEAPRSPEPSWPESDDHGIRVTVSLSAEPYGSDNTDGQGTAAMAHSLHLHGSSTGVTMLAALILFVSPPALATHCADIGFAFIGQPSCVALAYDGQHTQLQNHCSEPILVDASVLDGPGASPAVLPGTRVQLRDLSSFTVGLRGELHRAVAVVEYDSCDTGTPAP